MDALLPFIKQTGIMPHSMCGRYLNTMKLLEYNQKFMSEQNLGPGVGAPFFARTKLLMGLCHAKSLLSTHGSGSCREYFQRLFDPSSEGAKLDLSQSSLQYKSLLKTVKAAKEFQECERRIESDKDDSKLKKLLEILEAFFTIGMTKENSKVIIFTQYRQSAAEIKEYIEQNQNQEKKLIKSEVFVGVKGKDMS